MDMQWVHSFTDDILVALTILKLVTTYLRHQNVTGKEKGAMFSQKYVA